jgi:hypothetical protein
MLVTTKDEVPPVFKALAMNLRAKTWMMAGWADADSPAGEALLSEFRVGGCAGGWWCLIRGASFMVLNPLRIILMGAGHVIGC